MRPALKKTLKVAAGLAGVTVLGAAVGAWYVTRPEWQRRQVVKALHAAGWKGEIRALSVSLSGDIALAGVDLTAPNGGPVIALERAAASLSIRDALSGLPHVTGLTVEGLRVRSAPPPPAAAAPVESPAPERPAAAESPGSPPPPPSPPAGSGGAAPAVPKPLPRVLVDDARIAGEFAPGAGAPVVFDLHVRELDTTRGGRLVAAVSHAGVSVKADGAVRFEGVPLLGATVADFLRSARPAPDLDADVAFAPGGGSVRLSLRGNADALHLAARDGASRADLKVAAPYGEKPLVALGWRCDETVLAGRLPIGPTRFVSTGQAKWTPGAALEAEADYSGRPLFEGGPGHMAVAGAIEMHGARHFLIRHARVIAGDTASAPQLTAETRAPIAFTLTEAGMPRADNASGELLEVGLHGLPLAWFSGLAGGSPVVPRSGKLEGAFVLEAPAGGGWRLHMPRPVTASDVTLALSRGRTMSGLSLRLAGEAGSAPDGTLTVRDVAAVLSLAGGEAASLKDLNLSWSPTGVHQAACSFALDPARWPGVYGAAAAVRYCRETGLRLTGSLALGGDSLHSSTLRAAQLSAITAAGDTPVVARLEKPVALTAAGGREASALVTLREAPLTLVNPFLDGEPLEGVARDASIRLAMTPHGLSVASTAPARVYGLVWRPAGTAEREPSPIGVTGGFSWTPTAAGWRLRLDGLDALNRTGRGLRADLDWVHADAAPDRVVADLRGSLDAVAASIPAWLPARIAHGQFSAVADVKLDGEAGWLITLTGVAPEVGAAPRSLVCTGSSRPAGGNLSSRSTLQLKGPSGESRCEISAQINHGGLLEAGLDIDTLYPADWIAFSQSQAAPATPARPAPAPVVTPAPGAGTPAAPPSGAPVASTAVAVETAPAAAAAPFAALPPTRLRVGVKSVHYASETFGDVRGVVNVAPDSINLSEVQCLWRTLPIRASATLSGPTPWRHKVDLDVTDAKAEAFLGTFSADAASRLSGKLAVSLKASAEAAEPAGLGPATRGVFSVTGAGGLLRYAGKPDKVSSVTAGVFDLPGDLMDKIGGAMGRENRPVARLLHSVNLVRNALGEIKYDKLEFSAARASTGVWEPIRLRVLNSVLRVSADGRVEAPVAGVPWTERPCTLDLRVGGRMDFADTVRVWGGPAAEEKDGYVLGPVLRLDGTLGSIDANLMKSLSETMPGGGLVDKLKGIIP